MRPCRNCENATAEITECRACYFEAMEENERLRARVVELEDRSKWHPIRKKPPMTHAMHQITDVVEVRAQAYYSFCSGEWNLTCKEAEWRELPALPEKETEK